MSGFLVDPAAVTAASLRLRTVTCAVEEARGRLGAHVGAAAGTPAAGSLDDLLSQFSQSLAQFSLASAALADTVRGAAGAYRHTDGAVAAACETGATERGAGAA